MQPEIIVAVLVFTGAVFTSIAGAYATVRAASNKSKSESIKSFEALRRESDEREHARDVQLAVISSKMDTLWDIYAEDAIRNARTSGMVAANSPLAPTKKWDVILNGGSDLEEIAADARQLAEILNSPYDIAIELWARHKEQLLSHSGEEPVQVLWGTLLVVSMNAVKAHAKNRRSTLGE